MHVTEGMRLEVPFGRRYANGYVLAVSEGLGGIAVEEDRLKFIFGIHETPAIPAELLDLAKWMSKKYYTPLIHCLNCVSAPRLPKKYADSPEKFYKTVPNNIILNEEQRMAAEQILTNGSKRPTLLHGVTGSGKTEVYLRIIADVINKGKAAIMLVPEIALTHQTIRVFQERFGTAAVFTHSGLSPKERFNSWEKARTGEASVMIGPRSAVFAPFSNLGAIIIDEEHENTYRQSDLPPKFDAKEVALKRYEYAKNSDFILLMGSATPSLESYFRATEKGEFSLITMKNRINAMPPEIRIIDMRLEMAMGNTSVFSLPFQDMAERILKEGNQMILFLNRRGHSTFVSCRQCGHVMGCDDCRVNFTYHLQQSGDKLICHYCGRVQLVPKICPACESPYIRHFGAGTQKIEEEVEKLFPYAKALRMDFDTTRGKAGHAKILSAFRKNEAQILIGTQMIAKGLDFPNVTLVGVVAADLSLFTGDFRSAERTFSLLTQVAGRAGRAERKGLVYIQTYNPDHYSISHAKTANYLAFYQQEIKLRRGMVYPPFSHVFMILFSAADEKKMIASLHKLSAIMRYCNKSGKFEMIGPLPAVISKIKKQFRWKLLVKAVEEEMLVQFVIYCLQKLKENDPLGGIKIDITLNPLVIE